MKSDVEVLREALAEPIDTGPWRAINDWDDDDGMLIASVGHYHVVSDDRGIGGGLDEAEYIAACSPDRIKRLLDQHAKAIELMQKLIDANFDTEELAVQEEMVEFLSEATTPSDK